MPTTIRTACDEIRVRRPNRVLNPCVSGLRLLKVGGETLGDMDRKSPDLGVNYRIKSFTGCHL